MVCREPTRPVDFIARSRPPRARRVIRKATYVLPIRSTERHTVELETYLRWVSRMMPLVVVDGSPPVVFDAAHQAWSEWCIHVRPDDRIAGANGKVRGVLSSAAYIRTPHVIIADDDVRHTASTLNECASALRNADLVVPQNFFAPMPWHAKWDTARTLLNRAIGHDLPGTLGVHTSHLVAGYSSDVLFENLELIRTVTARGGACAWRPDIYVRRLPPTTAHFWGQRVRHAYDEFARPTRMAFWLSLLPLAVTAVVAGRVLVIAGPTLGAVVLAEVGRRRHDGRRWFSPVASLATPIWLFERSVCAWLAVIERFRGGVKYSGGRLLNSATPARRLAPPIELNGAIRP